MTILAIIGIAWIRWLDTHTLIAPLWTVSAWSSALAGPSSSALCCDTRTR
jgi:hypothetical protein